MRARTWIPGLLLVALAGSDRVRIASITTSYVAGVPNGREISIAELLDMRAGTFNYQEEA